jgi:hypothetical protein
MLRHLRTKFDLDTVKTVGNTLLQGYTLDVFPDQVEILVVDLHLRSYYGEVLIIGITIGKYFYKLAYVCII